MQTEKVATVFLLLFVCLTAASCQSPDTTKEPKRWKINGTDDVVLLIRKVDEDHPYFKALIFRKPKVDSELLPTLINRISGHCNVINVTKLVKNDLLVLQTAEDVRELASGDRIEAWATGSGRATRAKTAMAFARSSGGRPSGPATPQPPPKVGHHPASGSSSAGSWLESLFF